MMDKRLFNLLSHAKKYIVYYVLIGWFALMAQILAVFSLTGFMEKVMDDSHQLIDSYLILAVLAVSLVVRFVADRLSARTSYLAGAEAKQLLREKIFDKLLQPGRSYHSQKTVGELAELSTSGVEQLGVWFGTYLPLFCYSVLSSATLFFVLLFVNWKSSLVLLAFVLVSIATLAWFQKESGNILKKGGDENKIPRDLAMIMDVVFCLGMAAVVVVAALEFAEGAVTLAGALTVSLLAAEAFAPFRHLGACLPAVIRGREAGEGILFLLDLPQEEMGQGCWEENGTGIYMEDVCYTLEDGRKALKDVSMNLPAGSFISLVGEPGCGKSTIAGILAGKDRNYEGRILLGYREISELAEAELLRHITPVAHDSHIFGGTVEENLRMAKPLATEEELLAVLARVNLLTYFQERQGLATPLKEGGTDLSGGQRQLLALARALLHDTPIYIFDETASRIDTKSENRIIWNICELAKEKTVLLISDCLLHAVQSDCIYMMEHGQVTEKGTHKQLMQKNGAYRKLFLSQYEAGQYGKGEL